MKKPLKPFFVIAVTLVLIVAVGCQPTQPARGRNTPVRRVLLLGDSLTHGLFGTSPSVTSKLNERLAARGVSLQVIGFPAENVLGTWAEPPWNDEMRAAVNTFNPDMIVIQSILMPDGLKPSVQAAYLWKFAQLLDTARSRGAHVYIERHDQNVSDVRVDEQRVAERIQAEVAKPRGVEIIPLDQWIAGCNQPFLNDGWHFSAGGQECHSAAIAAAVDQLKAVVG